MSELLLPQPSTQEHAAESRRQGVAQLIGNAIGSAWSRYTTAEDAAIRRLQTRAQTPPEGSVVDDYGYVREENVQLFESHEHGPVVMPVSRRQAANYVPRHARRRSRHAK